MLKPHLAVDTEFRRTHKNNMKLALLQINDGEETFLVDTLAINDPKDYVSFLFTDKVTKIFHSCKEDLEAIYTWTKNEMKGIFDTQLANSFLDKDYSISYQKLVENELGIVLEKKETRSNWLRRPLTDSQLKYASLDVEYLIYLYYAQIKELSQSSKLDWLSEDIEMVIKNTFKSQYDEIEFSQTISKSEENLILDKFNKKVQEISLNEKINSTLFFSKKAQKDFLRHVLIEGLDAACNNITNWRSNLIKPEILEILK
tara:strand:+ start:433 stop:1206 length:774 start_codon:yes stop_codon:yes gene_type:complete